MSETRPRIHLVSLGLVVIGVAILCGLGVWQLKRLAWKTELLARIEALKYAPAEPLEVALNHLQSGRDVDFIRVSARCEPAPPQAPALIYTVTDDGPGWRPVVLCRLAKGPYPAVLLDLGIAKVDPHGQAFSPPSEALTGVVQTAPKRKPFMAMASAAPNEFGWRDAKGVAKALGAPSAPPIFVLLETPAASPAVDPRPTPRNIPNNHLGYAITWFGLALALIGVYVAMLRRRRTP